MSTFPIAAERVMMMRKRKPMIIRDEDLSRPHSARPLSGAQIRRGLSLPSQPSRQAIAWATAGLAAAGLLIAASESNGKALSSKKKRAASRRKKR